MNIKHKNIYISIFFYLFLSISSFSQSDSLLKYIEIAAKNNPTLLQRFAEYQAALQKVPQVGSLPDPELSIGVFLSPMELPGGNQVADVRLMQMFPWFGVLKNAKDEMSLMAKAKFEVFRDAKLQLFFDVQSTWYELNKLQQNIRISEKNIEILHTIERLTIVRFKAPTTGNGASIASKTSSPSSVQNSTSSGMNSMGGKQGSAAGSVSNKPTATMSASPMTSTSGSSELLDVYQIQIEIGELQNTIELLKNQSKTLLAQFNSYLNRVPSATVILPDTLISDTIQLSSLTLADSIEGNNPMLGMLQFEQQSLKARKQMVSRMGYPMIGLGVNYSLINTSEMSTSAMNGRDMIMPMVTVTLPIYRRKYRSMKTEVGLLADANTQNYRSTANSLQTEYYQALQLYDDAQRRISLYSNQYVLASKSLDILIKSFTSTATNLTDILRVRQQTLDYEYKEIEAVADNNISIAWLNRLVACSQIP